MSDEVAGLLSPEARTKLAEQGFVVVPEEFRLFHHAYDWQLYSSTPVFVTTDVAYHAWHQVFDKTLRDLETGQLAPALDALLTGMRKNASTQRKALEGTALEEDATRVSILLAVASAALAGDEDVKLIRASQGGEGPHRRPRRIDRIAHPRHRSPTTRSSPRAATTRGARR